MQLALGVGGVQTLMLQTVKVCCDALMVRVLIHNKNFYRDPELAVLS